MHIEPLANAEHQLVIEYREVGDLKPNCRAARKHTKKKTRHLAESIRRNEIIAPLVIDENDNVLAGNAVLEAAKLLGMTRVPVTVLRGKSEEEKRAFILAHNRLAEKAEWDPEILREELEFLVACDFDFEFTGFDGADYDGLTIGGEAGDEDEDLDLDETTPPVSRLGQLWNIGPHKLLVGDARDRQSYERILGEELVQLVVTDPPFNKKMREVAPKGHKSHSFQMATGEMTPTEFTALLRRSMSEMARVSEPGAIHYFFMDWQHIREILAAGEGVYSELKQLVVWTKSNIGLGAFYRSQHELVLVFKVGTAPHINNFGMGGRGRVRSNVWAYAGANGFRKGRKEDLEAHPTVKPVQMLVDAVLDTSKRGGIVLDAFAGSGSTLLAAARTGRRGYGIEIDPRYADVTILRLQRETGEEAVLDSGETFDELAAAQAALDEEAA